MFRLQGLAYRSAQCAFLPLVLLACASITRAQSPTGSSGVAPAVGPQPASVGVADPGSTWPGGVVYYDDHGCIAAETCPNLKQAIDTFNADFLPTAHWTERTSQTTWVDITLSGTGGRGEANSIGYPGANYGSISMTCNTDCNVATVLHEMGHIVGLYHEHTRTDRDTYVTVNYDNVIKGTWTSNFAIQMQNQQILSSYDYASVMQYPSYVDTANGGPVIETIPAGIPQQGTEGVPGDLNQDYSAGDKEAILRLYGAAPGTVTVTSNPVGLQVIVDNVPYVTPQTFTWNLNDTHTIGVADGVQTLTGDIENDDPNNPTTATFYYTYGRWSDSTSQNHTIIVTPGNGSPAFPTNKPAIATYTANFIQLVPYAVTVFPSSSGSVTPSPQPQTYSGASGSFFVARQQATLTATPGGTYHFYEFNEQFPYFWLPGGLSANPKTFFVPDTGNPVAVNAEFTTYPVYTVDVVASATIQNASSSNLWAYIDDGYWTIPKNFSPDPSYDGSSWNAGTTHKLSLTYNGDLRTNPPEQPYSFNTEFAFSSWSDTGAYTHTTAGLPAVSTAFTATVNPLYLPATNFDFPPCGGTASISPSSVNAGFYPSGTSLTYSAAPSSGWTFAGWTYDLTGTNNPANLTANAETLVYANFNTTDAPLTITSLSPSSVLAGSSSFTLTINGTGFTAGSLVAVNGTYITPVTYVSPTKLQVTINSSVVANAATFDVFVENFPSGSGCAVFAYDTFTVGATATPIVPYIQVNNGAWQQTSSVAVNLGDKVNLAGQNLSGGTWSWTGPNSFTASGRVVYSAPFASASNVYNLTYTNTSGVISTQAFTVTVNPTPVVPYIQVNNGPWQQTASVSVNVGDTVNLAGQNISGGSWSWSGPNTFTASGRTISHVSLPSGTNIYSLSYNNVDGVTSVAQTFTITINPTPLTPYLQVNNGPWQQASTVAVNVGDKVNLAPLNINGGSWSWTGPNSFGASGREVVAVPLTAASNAFTVTYTNTSGVPSTQIFTITINPIPVVPYIQVNNGPWQQISSVAVNIGDKVNLSGQNISGGSWSWTGPNTFTASTRVINGVSLPSGTNIYRLTYTNVDGAPSTPQAFTITVNPTPLTPYLQVNNGPWQQVSTVAVNLGDKVNLAPLNINGGSWSWAGPNSFGASAREVVSVPLSGSSNGFTVTYTNTSGVPSTLLFTITVNPTPVIPYIQVNNGPWQQTSSVTVTSGDTVSLAGQNISGGSWHWTGPNSFTSSSRFINNVPLTSGTNVYSLTYTNVDGVTSSPQTFTITVN